MSAEIIRSCCLDEKGNAVVPAPKRKYLFFWGKALGTVRKSFPPLSNSDCCISRNTKPKEETFLQYIFKEGIAYTIPVRMLKEGTGKPPPQIHASKKFIFRPRLKASLAALTAAEASKRII